MSVTMNQNNIKPQELRIGNWVKCIHTASENERHQITGVTKENTYLNALTFDYLTINDIEPIPLSEEVLLRCGFKHLAHAPWLLTNGRLTINKGNHDIFTFGNQVLNCEIKYLNQLQNLFYSLTGEELEVSWT